VCCVRSGSVQVAWQGQYQSVTPPTFATKSALTARSRAAPSPAAFQGISAERLPPFWSAPQRGDRVRPRI
jgi:hypothetical protein